MSKKAAPWPEQHADPYVHALCRASDALDRGEVGYARGTLDTLIGQAGGAKLHARRAGQAKVYSEMLSLLTGPPRASQPASSTKRTTHARRSP